MDTYGNDFHSTGSVMSRSELEEQRKKRGLCTTCGRKIYKKKLFKMEPITDHGRVLNGRCLNCHPIDAKDGAIPAVSRPATEEETARFNQMQNNLRGASTTSMPGSGGSLGSNGDPMARRRSSHVDRRTQRSSRHGRRTSQTQSSRSLQVNRTTGTSQGSFEYTSEASSTRSAMGAMTGRSSESIHSAPALARNENGARPGISNRPNSNRSISQNSYYSSRSRSSADGAARESDPRYRQNDDEESENYDYSALHAAAHEMADPRCEEQAHLANGGAGAPEPASLDYYHRSHHDRESSNRSLRSNDSHDTNGSSDYQRDGVLDRGGALQFDNGERRGRRRSSSASVQRRRYSVDSHDGSQGPQRFRDESEPRKRQVGSSRSIESGSSYDEDVPARQQAFSHSPSPDLGSLSESEEVAANSVRSTGSTQGAGSQYSGQGSQISGGQRSYSNGSSTSQEESPAVRLLRGAGNDFVEILNVMRDHADSADVQSVGMQTISNMELSDEESATLANIGAIQVIVDAMNAFAGDLELQVYGCRAIWNASGTPENQRCFVEAGALDAILQAMDAFASNGELQEQALAVLANLGAIEDNLVKLHECATVEQLVQAMNKHASCANVQVKGCLAIANLASHQTAHKRSIVEAGGGSAIVISMVMHPNNPELQVKALRALRNLSANCDQNRVELTNIGGIDAIISAMQVHRDSDGVQEAGAWTLSNLAGNADSKVLIGDCGGIDVIVRAMWVHSDKASVQEWSCRALFTLSIDEHNSKMILDVGGISAIVNAMQAHVDSAAVQEMGCGTLCNLAFDQQSKMRVVDEEALDAVVLAMVLYSDDGKVQEQSCHLLLQLCIAENFKAMQASNVGELVRSAAVKFPTSCGEPAERLIHVIEGYISEYL